MTKDNWVGAAIIAFIVLVVIVTGWWNISTYIDCMNVGGAFIVSNGFPSCIR